MLVESFENRLEVSCSDGQVVAVESFPRKSASVVVSSPLGFVGAVIVFEEIEFPASLAGMVSYVGHPATRALLETLGAETDATGTNGAPGKWAGPAIGESYLSVPLAQNARPDGWTANVAVESVAALKAIRCTRIA